MGSPVVWNGQVSAVADPKPDATNGVALQRSLGWPDFTGFEFGRELVPLGSDSEWSMRTDLLAQKYGGLNPWPHGLEY